MVFSFSDMTINGQKSTKNVLIIQAVVTVCCCCCSSVEGVDVNCDEADRAC